MGQVGKGHKGGAPTNRHPLLHLGFAAGRRVSVTFVPLGLWLSCSRWALRDTGRMTHVLGHRCTTLSMGRGSHNPVGHALDGDWSAHGANALRRRGCAHGAFAPGAWSCVPRTCALQTCRRPSDVCNVTSVDVCGGWVFRVRGIGFHKRVHSFYTRLSSRREVHNGHLRSCTNGL